MPQMSKMDKKPKVIVIGHSFGARQVATATLAKIPFKEEKHIADLSKNKIDAVIGLQGAFSVRRFVDGLDYNKIFYNGFPANVHKVILTSSKEDTSPMPYAYYALNENGIEYARKNEKYFNISIAEKNGTINNATIKDNNKIAYIDATAFIKDHNDIFNRQVGRLIWQAIK